MKPVTTPPQLTDEAWAFLQKECNHDQVGDVVFEGDQGNWNWLFGKIWKLCQPKEPCSHDFETHFPGPVNTKCLKCGYEIPG